MGIYSTTGSEFLLEDTKEEYVGYYSYILGTPYSGLEDDPIEMKTILYDIRFGPEAINFTKLNPNFGQHIPTPKGFKPTPTPKQYKQSVIARYFVKNMHTRLISEVIEATYNGYLNKSKTLFSLHKSIKIDWKISGPLHDVIDSSGTITSTGIIETNQRTMALHKALFPELPLVLPADDLAKITS